MSSCSIISTACLCGVWYCRFKNPWCVPAGLCGCTVGEGARHAEAQHPTEEGGYNPMKHPPAPPPPPPPLPCSSNRVRWRRTHRPYYPTTVCQTETSEELSQANLSCRLITPTVLLCFTTVSLIYYSHRVCASVPFYLKRTVRGRTCRGMVSVLHFLYA